MAETPAVHTAPTRRIGPGLLAATIATLAALAILLALGTWQVQRLAWKQDLIAQIEARAHGEAGEILPEEQWPAFSPQSEEYRRVRIAGRFDHAREVQVHGLLASRTRGQPIQGFYVLTPLEIESGAHVIVNRGFVPTELREPASRAESLPDEEVEIVGLVRASQERATFVPENDPSREQWLTRDVYEIAEARGIERVAPFYIDAEHDASAPAWPRGGGTILDLPNNHLQYAVTWYGLALCLLGVFAVFAWRKLRSGTAASR